MLWKILIALLAASVAAYFVPTPLELQNQFKSGQNFFVVKDYKKAIKQYDDIISTDSDFLTEDSVKVSLLNGEYIVGVITASYYQRANAYKNLKEYDKALEDFRIIVEKRKDSPSLSALAQFQIYDLFYGTGRYPNAINNAKKFIDKYPEHEKVDRSLYDIGWAYRELGKYDSSSIFFRNLVSRYDSSNYRAKALYQIGQNYFDQKDWNNARKIFEELILNYNPAKFNKKEFENIELRSVKERKIFDATGTRESDESDLQLVAKAEVKIGDCFDKMNNYEKSMEAYNKVISNYFLIPSITEMTYIRMADITIRLKTLEEGIYIYKAAIDNNFQNKELQAKLQFKIAQTYQDKKQYDKASDEYSFYSKGYSNVADKINFTVENANYFSVVMRYNAKSHEKVLIQADTFVSRHPNSDYIADILMLKGLSLRELKRFDEARTIFARIQKDYQKNNQYIASKIQYAKTYFDQRNWNEAKSQYLKIFKEDSSRVDKNELNYYIGLCNYYIENYSEAISALKNIEPNSTFYPISIGRISKSFISLKKLPEGLEYLNQLAVKFKDDSTGLSTTMNFALGDMYAAMEKYDSAFSSFNRVIMDSNKITENIKLQARYARGALQFQLMKYKEAIQDFDYCLKNETFIKTMTNLVASTNEKMAFSMVESEQAGEAVRKLDTLIKSSPDTVDRIKYMSSLAEVYFRIKDYDKSIKICEELIKKDTLEDNIKLKAYVTAANSYGSLGNIEKAKKLLTDASSKYPNSPYVQDVMYQFAMLHFSNQDFKNAADLLDQYIVKYPKGGLVSQANFFRGAAYFKMTKFDEALKSFNKFYQAYPNHKMAPEALFQIAECQFNLQKFDEAEKSYQIVYKKYPKSEFAANAMLNEGWAYYQQQKLEKMVEVFKSLVSKFHDSPYAGDALFSIGDYYYNKKDYNNAITQYEQMVKDFPQHPRIEEAKSLLHELAQINSYLEYEKAIEVFDSRDYAKSILELNRLIEKYPDADIVIGCKLNIASAYEQMGNYQKALTVFEEVFTKSENDPMLSNAAIFAKQHIQYLKSKMEGK
jgi:tol-pal system protein YbgF